MDKQESKELFDSEVPPEYIMTDEDVEREIRAYEEQFGMSSEEFLSQKRKGEFPDIFEAIAWQVLLKHR